MMMVFICVICANLADSIDGISVNLRVYTNLSVTIIFIHAKF